MKKDKVLNKVKTGINNGIGKAKQGFAEVGNLIARPLTTVVLVVCGMAIVVLACKKECKPGQELQDNKCVDTTSVGPVGPIDPEPEKEDKILYYEIMNQCGGMPLGTQPLKDSVIYWKTLPTTGRIIAKLYCKDARGPPANVAKRPAYMKELVELGVQFIELDTAYTNRDISPETLDTLANLYKVIIIKDLDYQY